MRRRRSRYEIYAAMLEAALQGSKKIRIMHSARLSYPEFTGCLDTLLKYGMLEYNEFGNLYLTTKKGKKFLRMWKDVRL